MLLAFSWIIAFLPSGVDPVCENRTTLESLVDCIVLAMPEEGSEGFVVPDTEILSDWDDVVVQMLAGSCDAGIVPVSLVDLYTMMLFTDAENQHSYCILYESADNNNDGKVDRGWGTLIVNTDPDRNLDISIPHPLNETNTAKQGIELFKDSGARTYVLAGAHRRSNGAPSPCQSSFQIADAAHNTQIFFHQTSEALVSFYAGIQEQYSSIQFHGMAASTCPGVDVYITQGLSTTPTSSSNAKLLAENLAATQTDWSIKIPGDTPTCGLNGTTNVQGRLLNGVNPPSVCTTSGQGLGPIGQFLHIEQKFNFRDAEDWKAAIMQTFPEIAQVNVEPTELQASELEAFEVYPNPAYDLARVSFKLGGTQQVQLALFDVLGRQVDVLFDGVAGPGENSVVLRTQSLPAGAYFLRLSGERISIGKLIAVGF